MGEGSAAIRAGVMEVNHKQAVGFRKWLEFYALNPEEEEWARNLSKEDLEALAEALEAEGYPIDENGRPIVQPWDEFDFWEAFEDAAQRIGRGHT